MPTRLLTITVCVLLFTAVGSTPRCAKGEVFVLRSGGRIEGEHLNPQRQAGEPYQVRTAEGVRLALAEKFVQRVIVKSDIDKQYEANLSKAPDTAAGQWALAEWCKESGLTAERKRHLQAVIALDPDHAEARQALGYSRHGSQWLTTEEYMESQGYVRYKGTWRVRQEVEIEARGRQQELAVKQWRQNIRRWCEQIAEGSRHAETAERELNAISDPYAAPALADALADGKQPRNIRMRCLEILGRLPPGLATQAYLKLAMDDSDEGIRDGCLDELKREGTHAALPRLVAELKGKDNGRVNRAGECLGRLGDISATLQLIDALITEHQYSAPQTGGGGTSLSFSSGGPGQGFGVPGRPKTVKKQHENPGVLGALASLHTGVNFQFDVAAWRRWYIQNRTSTNIDLRRDE